MFERGRSRCGGQPRRVSGAYLEGMALSAHAVAAELRRRQPGLGQLKLHKLLYYCQGHHLATFDEPLFGEIISAWDRGPVVGAVWHAERHQTPGPPGAAVPDEAQLNTVGYVLSRYGRMSGADLERLTHSEDPWRRADDHRITGTSARIEQSWLRDFFASQPADDDEPVLEGLELEAWLQETAAKTPTFGRLDDVAGIRSRVQEYRASITTRDVR